MITDKVGGSSAKPEVSKQSKEKRLKHKVSGYKSQSKRRSIAGCHLLLRTLIWSPSYYGHFFGAIQQNGHTFSCKPVDMAKFFGLLVTVLMGFHCTMYIVYCTDNPPCDSRRRNVEVGRGRGLRGREKGRGFLPLPLPYPPLPHRNRNHTMNNKIFELWAGDKLVTCTEDQEICAISGRNGIIWQIINHVISHSLLVCTYYLIEVPAKYGC